MSTLTEPAGLLVAAAMVELLLDASLLDAGTAYRRGPVEVTDPLLGWVAESLLAHGGAKTDLQHAVTGNRGAQMIRRTMDRLVERGLAAREPRRVFGYLAMPVFGSALRVHEVEALHHDRAAVRAVAGGRGARRGGRDAHRAAAPRPPRPGAQPRRPDPRRPPRPGDLRRPARHRSASPRTSAG